MNTPPAKTRIVILGGGFGGVSTARHLEQLCRYRPDVEVVLVSRDNFLLMTPLLFEVCSGVLDVRDCSFPLRAYLRTTRVIEASVASVDLNRRVVHLRTEGETSELSYDQLVLALGGRTNRKLIPGSEHAFTFKTLADALLLRNHVIERFERADAETDPARRRRQLTFAVVGGGLVGVELFGELMSFAEGILPYYRSIGRDDLRFVLLQGGDRLMPEIDPALAAYGTEVLRKRPGAEVRLRAAVRAIDSAAIHLAGETIEAETVVLAAGVVPDPVVATLPVERNRRGQIVTDGAMRCPSRPGVWAIGDCASIPAADGTPYPTLAQHAIREGRALAENVLAAHEGLPPRPFVYRTLGVMGSLGRGRGFGQLLGLRVRGWPAWFVRRTYYLLQMPGWGRRLRILTDWLLALLFRPDAVKVNLDGEIMAILRERLEPELDAEPAAPAHTH